MINDRISEDTILAIPSTDYPFHIHVDSPNVGTGCVLILHSPEGKQVKFQLSDFRESRTENDNTPRGAVWKRFSFADL